MSRIPTLLPPARRAMSVAVGDDGSSDRNRIAAALAGATVGALMLALLAGSARADDAGRSRFDGGYVGIAAGVVAGQAAVPLANAGLAGLADDTAEFGTTRLESGFGQTLGQFYLGLESSGTFRPSSFGDTVVAGGFVDSASSVNFGISARAGWLVEPNLLLFGRIGWERLDYLKGATPNLISLGSDDFIDGLRLGLGADLIATKYLSTRLEFAYIDYDDVTQGIGGTAIQVEPEEATFRLGVVYKF